MADETTNRSDEPSRTDEPSSQNSPKPISRATLVMIGAAVIFVIIATVLFTMFFKAPTGVPERSSISTQSIPDRQVVQSLI